MNPIVKVFPGDILFESSLMGYGRISTAHLSVENLSHAVQFRMYNYGSELQYYIRLSTKSVRVRFELFELWVKNYYKSTKTGIKLSKLYTAIP